MNPLNNLLAAGLVSLSTLAQAQQDTQHNELTIQQDNVYLYSKCLSQSNDTIDYIAVVSRDLTIQMVASKQLPYHFLFRSPYLPCADNEIVHYIVTVRPMLP